MNRLIRLTTPAMAALALCAAAVAQTGTPASPQPGKSTATTPSATSPGGTASGKSAASSEAKLARADASFLKQASQNGHAEIEASKLALQKASSENLKTFAQKMVDDHTKANEELMSLAQSKGLSDLPTEPSTAQKAKLQMLSSADGANFDKRYAEQMGVKAHQDTVKLFQKASKDAKDPEVKAWAAKKLPDLQQHLKMAKGLDTTVAKASTRAPSDRKQ